MIVELENFIIESNGELKYKDEIINNLQKNTAKFLEFFELKKLSKKLKIVIYDSHEEYKAHMEEHVSDFKDWMIGDTYGGNINLLSYDEVVKLDSHKNMTFNGFLKCILHEFVHVCQSEYGNNQRELKWFWEGLAVNLSGQPNKGKDLSDCDFALLKKDFNNVEGNYDYAYEIVKYILEEYSHDEVMEFVKNPEYLKKVEREIFERAIEKQYKK